MHRRARTHTRVHIHRHTNTPSRVHIRTRVRTRTHTRIYTPPHAYTHTHTHTRTHAHTHTHTHTTTTTTTRTVPYIYLFALHYICCAGLHTVVHTSTRLKTTQAAISSTQLWASRTGYSLRLKIIRVHSKSAEIDNTMSYLRNNVLSTQQYVSSHGSDFRCRHTAPSHLALPEQILREPRIPPRKRGIAP